MSSWSRDSRGDGSGGDSGGGGGVGRHGRESVLGGAIGTDAAACKSYKLVEYYSDDECYTTLSNFPIP